MLQHDRNRMSLQDGSCSEVDDSHCGADATVAEMLEKHATRCRGCGEEIQPAQSNAAQSDALHSHNFTCRVLFVLGACWTMQLPPDFYFVAP